MAVNLKRKADGVLLKAMFFDGTQTGAVGISAWAGSYGNTINMRYRGGDNSDWVLVFPFDDEELVSHEGDWVFKDTAGFFPVPGAEVSTDYEAVPDV